MKFEGYKLSKLVMYNGWIIGLGMLLSWIILYPLVMEGKFVLFETIHDLFFRDIKITSLMLGIILWAQLEGFLSARKKIKLLEVLENKTLFHLLNGKTYEFKYSELSSLEYTNDLYKIFLFTFKDGRQKKMSKSVKNSELAFEMIRKKIQENR